MRWTPIVLREEGPESWVCGIDPGTQAVGVALLEGSRGFVATLRPEGRTLVERAREVRAALGTLAPKELALLAIEDMAVYSQRDQKGDPNDLIKIALIEGVALGVLNFREAWLPKPGEWTGGVPKEIRHARIEKELVPPVGRTSEHARDALGLALKARERLKWRHR